MDGICQKSNSFERVQTARLDGFLLVFFFFFLGWMMGAGPVLLFFFVALDMKGMLFFSFLSTKREKTGGNWGVCDGRKKKEKIFDITRTTRIASARFGRQQTEKKKKANAGDAYSGALVF